MPGTLTANAVVAYNLMRIRTSRGLNQEQARALLKPYGLDLSKAAYSAAERSYDGNRVRKFDAEDLLAMSLAFGVPVPYFFMPPRPDDRQNGELVRSGTVDVQWPELLDAITGGSYREAIFLRMMELPEGERPKGGTQAARVIGALGAGRIHIWEEPRGPIEPGDPRWDLAMGSAPRTRKTREDEQ